MSVAVGHKRKLLDEAQALLSYHRKAAIRALGVPAAVRVPWIITRAVRPRMNRAGCCRGCEAVWQAADYACGRRLVAMLPEWIPA